MTIRKVLLLVLLVGGISAPVHAQMSDEQVVNYVKQGKAAGKADRDIGRELLARGVTREQVERIRTTYATSGDKTVQVGQAVAGRARQEQEYVEVPLAASMEQGTGRDTAENSVGEEPASTWLPPRITGWGPATRSS